MAHSRWQNIICAAALVALVSGLPRNLSAQGRKAKAESVNKTLRGQTGWPINITYFNSTQGAESPVLIFLHDKGGNQKIWEPTAKAMQQKGYAVITVDLRKHGQSKPEGETKSMDVKPNDYTYMVADDLEVVKQFVLEEHHKKKLNIRKTGIVAIGASAPVALAYSVVDWRRKPYPDGATLNTRTPRGQDVRALLMISPESSVPRLPSTGSLKFLRTPALNVAMCFLFGEADRKVKKDAEKMYKLVAPNAEAQKRMIKLPLKTKLNGTMLLSARSRKNTEQIISKFFDDHLRKLEGTWQNRKNRLTN